MKCYQLIIICLIICTGIDMQAQTGISPRNKKALKSQIREAETFIERGNFESAGAIYAKLTKVDSTNAEYYYKLGYCDLNSALRKERALECLRKSGQLLLKQEKKPVYFNEVRYYLAKAYRLNYHFQKAVNILTELEKEIDSREREFIKSIQREKQYCQNGLKITKERKNIKITNLGKTINSEFTEHSPVLPADQSVIIFTSRRKTKENDVMDTDGQFDEDILISYRKGDTWTYPVPISDSINTESYEATIGISADGQQLFFYRDDGNGDGNIYKSELTGENWNSPEKLVESINTKYRETHTSLSADGNMLFFTSDRKGGYGGLDIYVVRKLPTGEWSEAENLGPVINTHLDEEGPYFHPDGSTLYFSSKNHTSIGGFDIFTSVYNSFNNSWSKPENIGYPINTTEDDVFYVPTANGLQAYYASYTNDGYGKSDIYLIDLLDAQEKALTIVKGIISTCDNQLSKIKITILNNKTQEITGIYRPNSHSGKYLFVLKKGEDYLVEYEYKGKLVKTEVLSIPVSTNFEELTKDVYLKTGEPCDENSTISSTNNSNKNKSAYRIKGPFKVDGQHFDEKIVLKDSYFDKGGTTLGTDNTQLLGLASYLKDNRGAIVSILAFPEPDLLPEIQAVFCKKRTDAIKEFLLEHQVEKSQIQSKGCEEFLKTTGKGKLRQNIVQASQVVFNIVRQGDSKAIIEIDNNLSQKLEGGG